MMSLDLNSRLSILPMAVELLKTKEPPEKMLLGDMSVDMAKKVIGGNNISDISMIDGQAVVTLQPNNDVRTFDKDTTISPDGTIEGSYTRTQEGAGTSTFVGRINFNTNIKEGKEDFVHGNTTSSKEGLSYVSENGESVFEGVQIINYVNDEGEEFTHTYDGKQVNNQLVDGTFTDHDGIKTTYENGVQV